MIASREAECCALARTNYRSTTRCPAGGSDQLRILVRAPIANERFYPFIERRINRPKSSRRLIVNCSRGKIFHVKTFTVRCNARTGFFCLPRRNFSEGG